MEQGKVNIKSLSFDDLESYMLSLGLKRFRYQQVRNWLYRNNATGWDVMSNLPKKAINQLKKSFYIGVMEPERTVTAEDGVEKFLFRCSDGSSIETVMIPDEGRITICVSTQAGCKMGCSFCITGQNGFKRNLNLFEIIEQIQYISRLYPDKSVTNLVFMGMGEPLDNLDNLVAALTIITGQHALSFAPRRVTVSTCGLIPQIAKLGKLFPLVNLAISLNGTTDEVRNKIMPINKKYSLDELLAAAHSYPLPGRKKITFEYILIKGLNDSMEDAGRLIKLLKKIPSKVNLILLNSGESCSLKPSSRGVALAFQKTLMAAKLSTTIRKSKGSDIMAACGQLSGKGL